MGQNANDGFDPNAGNVIWAVVIQADGKIVIGGVFTNVGGLLRSHIARLNTDGSLDAGFNPGADRDVVSLAVQTDGKILVGGDFSTLAGQTRSHIGRLNPDGSLDPSFNPGADSSVYSLAVQTDGKILVGGDFGTLAGQTRSHIGRLKPDGSLDTAFNPGASSDVRVLVVQPDGRILAAGGFGTLGGQPRNHVGRLNANGSLDTAFNPEPSELVYGLALQADGKIVVGGGFTTLCGQARTNIGRLNPNGSLDTNFNPTASGLVTSLAVQPDGKILVGGTLTSSGGYTRNYLGRLNADGSLDGFNPAPNSYVMSMGVQPDGKIVVAGYFSQLGGQTRHYIGRLYPDGSLDRNLNPGANGDVLSTAMRPDGRILVGGRFTYLGGQTRNRIGGLKIDGSLDPDMGTGFTYNDVCGLAVQGDGKILVAGDFTALNDRPRPYLGRLWAFGHLDEDFNPQPNAFVHGLAIQADGKILVGGGFTTLAGQPRNHIGRLNGDGSLDNTFVDPRANSNVWTVAVQADGKILVGGEFTALGGQPRNKIGRLNPDGSLDTAFNPGASGIVAIVVVQEDGKILVGGVFSFLAGQQRYRIGRLNPDGSLDTSFVDPRVNNWVGSLLVQADGKIVAGGDFTGMGGQTRNYIGRLNPDGTLDTTFNPGAGFCVRGLAGQADGKILVGGVFATLGGQPRSHIGRLTSGGAAVQNLSLDSLGTIVTWSRSGTGPQIQQVTFEFSRDGDYWSWTALGNATRVSGGWQLAGVALPLNENFLLRARGRATGGNDNAGSSLIESVRQFYINLPPPALVRQPQSQSVSFGGDVMFSVSATGDGLSYQWRFNGVNIPGATRTTLALRDLQMADAGQYSVVVSNRAGSVTSTSAMLRVVPALDEHPQSQTVSLGFPAVFSVAARGGGLTYQWQFNGVNVPGATDATLALSGLEAADAGRYSVLVWNESGFVTSQSAVLTVATGPFVARKAAYHGLGYDEQRGVAPQSSGSFTLNTTAKAKFTGTLRFGGKTYSLSGPLDTNGHARVTLSRARPVPLVIDLQMDLVPGSGRIIGTVNGGTWTANLDGDRVLYDGKTVLAPQAGKYTLVIPGDYAQPGLPGGDSYATVSVDSAGKIRLTGTLADGTKVSQAIAACGAGQWPLHVSLCSGQGLLLSWLTFSNTAAADLGGEVIWIKPALGNAKYYPAGFHLEASAVGSRYTKPATGQNVLALSEAVLVVSGGDLAGSITTDILLGPQNRVTDLSGNKLVLTFVSATGLFKGNVVDPATRRKVSFNGVILQKPNRACGCFMSGGRSGRILLQAR